MLEGIDADINHFESLYPCINESNIKQYYTTDDFNEKFTSNNEKDLNIIHLNIRSLNKNGNELVLYLESINRKFDIVCLSETWIKGLPVVDDAFPSYLGFHSIRNSRNGGGCSIYVNKKLKSSVITEFTVNEPFIETVFVKISLPNKILNVGCCYRPPNADMALFQNFIEDKVSLIASWSGDLVFGGDFNLDMLKINEDTNSENFYHAMNSYSLIPIISKPSRITDTSYTLIDQFFVSKLDNFASGMFCIDITDHYPIFLVYKNYFTTINDLPDKISYRIINDTTLNDLYMGLMQENLVRVLELDIDASIELLHQIILENLNRYCPIITKYVSPKDKSKPWITNLLKSKIKAKEFNYRLLKYNAITRQAYNQFRNDLNSLIRRSKLEYHNRLFDRFKNNMKKTWSSINGILGKNLSKSRIKSLLHEEILYDNSKDIADIFNAHFSTVAQKIDDSIPVPGPGNPAFTDYLNNTQNQNNFTFVPILAEDISRIIGSFENKSSHISTYSVKVIKHISPVIVPVLKDLVNKSLATGTFPNFCKIARVVPVFKSGSTSSVGNYRPISILPIFSKIFEKVVHKQVSDFLFFNNILNPNQYGFRKNHSTADAIADMTQCIYDSLDLGETVISFFLDFSKAFDTVNHRILLHKLQFYGIRDIELNWFQSYLSGRLQYVSLEGFNSQVHLVDRGVPQGSILGPLLFLIFINDFPNCSRFFKFTLFADDSTLTCKFNNVTAENMALQLEDELHVIHSWLNANRLKLNSDKSHFICFSYRKNINMRPIKIGNGTINEVNSTKFLGLILDKNLNFKEHITHISNKCSKSIGILFKLNYFLPTNILKMLYSSMILPYLNYGIEAWFGAARTDRNKVFILQKKSIRAIYNLPFNTHTNTFFKDNNILKIHELYKLNLCSLVYRYTQPSTDLPLADRLQTISSIHSYNTRHNQNLATPRYNLTKTQSSFVYNAIHAWNNIPLEIKNCNSLNTFKSHLKEHYCSLY